jgi:hypothetical protein
MCLTATSATWLIFLFENEAAFSSKTSVAFYQTAWRHYKTSFNGHHCENLNLTLYFVRFEVLTSVMIKIQIISAMTLCQWVNSTQYFGETYCLHLEGQLVLVSDPEDGSSNSSGAFTTIYKLEWQHIPQDFNLIFWCSSIFNTYWSESPVFLNVGLNWRIYVHACKISFMATLFPLACCNQDFLFVLLQKEFCVTVDQRLCKWKMSVLMHLREI